MGFQISFIQCNTEFQHLVLEAVSEWKNSVEFYTVQTSGSTGTPKSINLKRTQLVASAERSNAFFNLNETSTVLLCLSPKTIAGKMILIRALVGNYAVDVVEPTSNPLMHLPTNKTYDFASLVPFQLHRILEETPYSIELFKTILLGGMPLSLETEKNLMQFNCTFYMGFGMTETVSHIAIREVGKISYSCMNGVTISINENCCLIINDKCLNIEKLVTTDVIKMLSPNEFIWMGRNDFVINSGGIKIHPEQIERTISKHITGDFIVSYEYDSTLHQKCILISCNPISDEVKQIISQAIKTHFNKYAIPKKYICSPIIRRENGKIDRIKTRNLIADESK